MEKYRDAFGREVTLYRVRYLGNIFFVKCYQDGKIYVDLICGDFIFPLEKMAVIKKEIVSLVHKQM